VAVVVSDTSPVRALIAINRLELLLELFREVIIPPAVASELLQCGERFEAVDISNYAFIRVQAPEDTGRVQALRLVPHAGESEAIALAVDIKADAILMDELRGRAAPATWDLRRSECLVC
jgi:predicted nucleic acid-binding protein